jgi:hypothetical protein
MHQEKGGHLLIELGCQTGAVRIYDRQEADGNGNRERHNQGQAAVADQIMEAEPEINQ